VIGTPNATAESRHPAPDGAASELKATAVVLEPGTPPLPRPCHIIGNLLFLSVHKSKIQTIRKANPART